MEACLLQAWLRCNGSANHCYAAVNAAVLHDPLVGKDASRYSQFALLKRVPAGAADQATAATCPQLQVLLQHLSL